MNRKGDHITNFDKVSHTTQEGQRQDDDDHRHDNMIDRFGTFLFLCFTECLISFRPRHPKLAIVTCMEGAVHTWGSCKKISVISLKKIEKDGYDDLFKHDIDPIADKMHP